MHACIHSSIHPSIYVFIHSSMYSSIHPSLIHLCIDLTLKVLGYSDLLRYCDKFGFHCSLPNTQMKAEVGEKEMAVVDDLPEFAIPWRQMRTIDNEAYATDVALDLLDRLLVYDHVDGRITASQALLHPFFKSLNQHASKTIVNYNRDVLSLSQRKKMQMKKKMMEKKNSIVVKSSNNHTQNEIKHQTTGKDDDK